MRIKLQLQQLHFENVPATTTTSHLQFQKSVYWAHIKYNQTVEGGVYRGINVNGEDLNMLWNNVVICGLAYVVTGPHRLVLT